MSVDLADTQHRSVDAARLVSLGERVLEAEGYRGEAECSVILVSDERMAEMNRLHLGRQGATDVLALPLEELRPGQVEHPPSDGPPLHLGDVYIAPDYVFRQAQAYGIPGEDEMALMVVHGVLHLLGYDHQDDLDAERMERRERSILREAGIERR